MVAWFAALFYLPRLFVYHAQTEDEPGKQRFIVMERKLYTMAHIGMGMTWVFGLWLMSYYPLAALAAMGWLHAKLSLVLLLMGYHLYCGQILRTFRDDQNQRGHIWYRWFNELPVALLFGIVILVEVQPF